MAEPRKVLIDPLVDNNPVTLQVLGICSALAVTTSMMPALIMCIALTSVAALSGAAISSIRPDTEQHPHHRADYDHRVLRDHRGPGIEGVRIRDLASSCRYSWA